MKRSPLFLLVGLAAATLFVFIFLAGRTAPAAATPAAATKLQIADRLYAQGDYALAAESYRQLVDEGYADPALFYNLGISYLQADDLGRALWSLRSAQELAPRDQEVRSALDEVQAELAAAGKAGATAPVELTGFGRLAVGVRTWVTVDELASLALALWVGLAILLLVGNITGHGRVRNVRRGLSAVAGVGLAAVLILLAGQTSLNGSSVSAVVVGENVELRSGPGAGFGAAATAPTGAEVRIAEVRGAWVQVALADGASGWAPAAAVAAVGAHGPLGQRPISG